tara:strand:- start:42 stop:779 length:738 start_codon:yes stop_codon:yes gene_type:complete
MIQKKNFYKKNGYTTFKNFFSKKKMRKIKSDLINISKKRKKDIFFDNKNRLRRIEKIYNKSTDLSKLNKDILTLLNKFFGEKYAIFKDKVNIKVPGGDGFAPHYDGVFYFKRGKRRMRGWYEYSDVFVNCLIALDQRSKNNGYIEIAKENNIPFEKLIKNMNSKTRQMKKSVLKTAVFKKLPLNIGDITLFSSKCLHKSKKNSSNRSRSLLYYTYNPSKYGNNYFKYYKDKKNSSNKNKTTPSDS